MDDLVAPEHGLFTLKQPSPSVYTVYRLLSIRRRSGLVVSALDLRSEGWWFVPRVYLEPRRHLISIDKKNVISLHRGVQIGTSDQILAFLFQRFIHN